MAKQLTYSVLSLTLSFMFLALDRQVSFADTTTEAHIKVQQIYKKQLETLKKVDRMISEITRSPETSDGKRVELLRHIDRYKEYKLRVSFMRRLSQEFDSYYVGQPLTPFIIERLAAMADYETRSPEPNKNMTLFILGCRDVLLKRPTYHKKPLDLLLRYMNYTSITKIKTSSRFYNEQDYSNGTETFEANKIRPDEIGLLVEDKIKSSVKTLEEYEEELFKNAPKPEAIAAPAPVTKIRPKVSLPKTPAKPAASAPLKPRKANQKPEASTPPDQKKVKANKAPPAQPLPSKRMNDSSSEQLMDQEAFKKLFKTD